jgi:hypothetical protein
VLVAGGLVTHLAVQAHERSIGGDQVVRPIAIAGCGAEQDLGHRPGIQLVGFGAQAAPLGTLVGLGGMEEANLIALLRQELAEMLPLARGGLQPNHDLAWWHP